MRRFLAAILAAGLGLSAASAATIGPSNPSGILTGQVVIATTGTAVCIPSLSLANGLVVKAKSTNAAQTTAYSGMVGSTGVTTTYDGTGNGYPLAPGEAMSFGATQANLICFNGTQNDVFSYGGN